MPLRKKIQFRSYWGQHCLWHQFEVAATTNLLLFCNVKKFSYKKKYLKIIIKRLTSEKPDVFFL